MKSDPEVQRALETYQLGLPACPRRTLGELLGRGVGSSIEFQEYRQYVPGDDIRHLDWGAFAARTPSWCDCSATKSALAPTCCWTAAARCWAVVRRSCVFTKPVSPNS